MDNRGRPWAEDLLLSGPEVTVVTVLAALGPAGLSSAVDDWHRGRLPKRARRGALAGGAPWRGGEASPRRVWAAVFTPGGQMEDYGRPIRFGVFPTPDPGALDEILALTRIAEDENLDFVGIQDHPYQRR